jgi:hypothetical protein
MKLPTFLCVGAQKSGTTSLQDILIQHPNIYLPKIKETHFFDNGELNYDKGVAWYSSEYFSDALDKRILGEISTNYMFLDYIPKRIHDTLGPDTKLIFMLRNPVNRAYSQFMMNRQNFFETKTFEEALKAEKERTDKDEYSKKIFGYAQRGLYTRQIENFLKFFPKEQMFFIIFETDFLNNKTNTLKELCKFLEVPPYSFKLNIKKNVMSHPGYRWIHKFLYDPTYAWFRKPFKLFIDSKQKREWIKFKIRSLNRKKISSKNSKAIEKSSYEFLHLYFKEDIQTLQKLINKDLSHWIKSKDR